MQVIETFPTLKLAERAREVYVEAQRTVDRVVQKVMGGPAVHPPADEVYFVFDEGKCFAVAFEDPSFEEARDEPAERVYDCGD